MEEQFLLGLLGFCFEWGAQKQSGQDNIPESKWVSAGPLELKVLETLSEPCRITSLSDRWMNRWIVGYCFCNEINLIWWDLCTHFTMTSFLFYINIVFCPEVFFAAIFLFCSAERLKCRSYFAVVRNGRPSPQINFQLAEIGPSFAYELFT